MDRIDTLKNKRSDDVLVGFDFQTVSVTILKKRVCRAMGKDSNKNNRCSNFVKL